MYGMTNAGRVDWKEALATFFNFYRFSDSLKNNYRVTVKKYDFADINFHKRPKLAKSIKFLSAKVFTFELIPRCV